MLRWVGGASTWYKILLEKKIIKKKFDDTIWYSVKDTWKLEFIPSLMMS